MFKLRCSPRIYSQISNYRNKGSHLYGITNDHSDDDIEWKRKEDTQNKSTTRGDVQDAGKFIKVIDAIGETLIVEPLDISSNSEE